MFEDIDPTFREWLFAREIMRRLGFSPDEIFFAVNQPGTRMVENGAIVTSSKFTIVLRIEAQGRIFNWTIGETDVPNDKLESHFEYACERWNSSCNSPELEIAFRTSAPFKMGIPLMHALHNKGFVIREWN